MRTPFVVLASPLGIGSVTRAVRLDPDGLSERERAVLAEPIAYFGERERLSLQLVEQLRQGRAEA